METSVGTERQENETTPEYLIRLKDMGFLFHGSSNSDIQQLEPRYTFDPKSDTNTDTAVFATDNVTWSTIFGVYGGHKGWSTSVTDGDVVAKIPLKDKDLVEGSAGTVYVLPRKSFEEPNTGSQYKSYETVTPLNKVDVTVEDFYNLGGKIEWL